MPAALAPLFERLQQQAACLVRVQRVQGSAPREVGAWMAVWHQDQIGTIGGGNLEWQVLAAARVGLSDAGTPWPLHRRYALGPSLGQCCGGQVEVLLERVSAADIDRLCATLTPALHPVALFGAGHVGQAIVQVLSRLPFALHWIDSRDGIFPAPLPAQVRTEHSDPVEAAVAGLAPQSQVLIMSFSHAEDLEIVAACLKRQRERGDLALIGLMGSHTKWASFSQRLAARGFSHAELAGVTCPIGLLGINGKQPEVIAVSVAAQLLQLMPAVDLAV